MIASGAVEFETAYVNPESVFQGFQDNGFRVKTMTRAEFNQSVNYQTEGQPHRILADLILSSDSAFLTIDTFDDGKIVVEVSGDNSIMRMMLCICYASGGKGLQHVYFGKKLFLFERLQEITSCLSELSKTPSCSLITYGKTIEAKAGKLKYFLSAGRCIPRLNAPERWFICLDWRHSLCFWQDHQSIATVENRLRQRCSGELIIKKPSLFKKDWDRL